MANNCPEEYTGLIKALMTQECVVTEKETGRFNSLLKLKQLFKIFQVNIISFLGFWLYIVEAAIGLTDAEADHSPVWVAIKAVLSVSIIHHTIDAPE